jgi:hypothetical protein
MDIPDNVESLTLEQVSQMLKEHSAAFMRDMERLRQERAERAAADEKRWAEYERLWGERDKFLAERDKLWVERDKQQAERDKRWERQRKALNEQIGGVGKSMGEHAEYFFRRALSPPITLDGVTYEIQNYRVYAKQGDMHDEFDIMLRNTARVFIVEVKYKVRRQDLHHLIDRKLKNFRAMCPEYADGRTIHLAIAGFSFDEGVAEEAGELGVAVLQKDGKNMEFKADKLKAF